VALDPIESRRTDATCNCAKVDYGIAWELRLNLVQKPFADLDGQLQRRIGRRRNQNAVRPRPAK